MGESSAARRTFAIISHPDAGKTTLTERLLLYGGAIQLAGTVKARKARRHATSDWMAIERERGISVTSAVMQFEHRGHVVNLLDTPGHEDFSEDTYRTLTAVDSALMVIDAARGVEARTRKLMEICRLRATPVMTFVNKLDRESRDPIELLDEIEQVLGVRCAPVTWPVGSGRSLRGVYHLGADHLVRYQAGAGERARVADHVPGLASDAMAAALGSDCAALREAIELVGGVCDPFDPEAYLAGVQTPVFFGSALNDLGVAEMLDAFVEHAPGPLARPAREREVDPGEAKFTGFVFKIQANMDPQHRDRIAFLRVTSGCYRHGMKLHHVRAGREMNSVNAITFMARERARTEEARAGDIIGIVNHGTLRIGDTLTEGEPLHFTGIPNFAPEIFRRVELRDPLRLKALQKGLDELSEEGATQVFRPIGGNEIILGAVGVLQFDVVAWRLRNEYGVESRYQPVQIATARWVDSGDSRALDEFTRRNEARLARDAAGELAYLAPTMVNLDLARERWPAIEFRATREA